MKANETDRACEDGMSAQSSKADGSEQLARREVNKQTCSHSDLTILAIQMPHNKPHTGSGENVTHFSSK